MGAGSVADGCVVWWWDLMGFDVCFLLSGRGADQARASGWIRWHGPIFQERLHLCVPAETFIFTCF